MTPLVISASRPGSRLRADPGHRQPRSTGPHLRPATMLPRPARLRLHPLFWHHLAADTLLLPAHASAQAPESSTHLRIPSSATPIIRLGVEGRVRIITSDAAYLDVMAQVSVRGRTIGVPNGRSRPPYRLISTHAGDTIVVAHAPRPSLRAVGISWEREQLDHVIVVPAGSHLLIERESSDVKIDGSRIPRCARGRVIWTRSTGALCQATVARQLPTHDETRAYERMLRLGTGADAYPLRRVVLERTLAHAR